MHWSFSFTGTKEESPVAGTVERRHLQIADIDDISVVELLDRKFSDPQHLQGLSRELSDLIVEDARQNLILDFRNIRRLPSNILGTLVTFHKQVQGVRGRLVLCNLDQLANEMLEIVQLNRLFEIWADCDPDAEVADLVERFRRAPAKS